jgi:GMP synthase-like glutamine amidotransferase
VRLLVVQNEHDKHLGRLARPLREAGAAVDVRSSSAELPPLDGYAGVVVLPGLADPVDDEAPVHRARAAIAQALTRNLPVLGICLGAQLLAQAAGGRAIRCPPEVGYRRVETTPAARDDELMADVPPAFDVFQYHLYAFEPPACSAVLARSDAACQAFRVGASAWGIQFHPEPTLEMVDDWTTRTAHMFRVHGVDPARVAADARRAGADAERISRAVASRFVAQCAPA